MSVPTSVYLDGCPECLTRNNHPHTTEEVPSGVQCYYTCRVCDSTWATSWWDNNWDGGSQ